ncbi:MAG: hypothetical protein H6705_04010 [Myxococcales bacterium]|nr:hypothetical protein [Myxococcales bacterium]
MIDRREEIRPIGRWRADVRDGVMVDDAAIDQETHEQGATCQCDGIARGMPWIPLEALDGVGHQRVDEAWIASVRVAPSCRRLRVAEARSSWASMAAMSASAAERRSRSIA